MPVKFQFGTLFEGLISISGISLITTKIEICYLEVIAFSYCKYLSNDWLNVNGAVLMQRDFGEKEKKKEQLRNFL